ncbi:MAG TPA: hypothetical protein VMS43_17340 [Allosphingosinicella sp.]|nr:hypothetical protein [Allosphingosinicella sp.]
MAAQRIADSGQRPALSHIYRYRTKALVGPWRRTRAQALADALHAGQVRRDERDRHELRWMVEGRIEERRPDSPAAGSRARRLAPPPGV